MRKKRKRTRLRPKPFIVLGLIVNISLGLLFSPLTSVTRVRIVGAAPWDQARLTRVAATMQDIPCAQVHPNKVESLVMALPEVYKTSLSRNLFGSGVLNLSYRVPVARVDAGPSLGLTLDGVVYPAAQLPPELPVIKLAPGEPKSILCLTGNWAPSRIAELAVQLRGLFPRGDLTISLADARGVWLNMGAGRVVLGSLDALDAKMRVLRERLIAQPDFLSTVQELNLTSPRRPAIVPKKVETNP